MKKTYKFEIVDRDDNLWDVVVDFKPNKALAKAARLAKKYPDNKPFRVI